MKTTGCGAVAGVCVFFAATCVSAAELSKNEATKLLTFMGKENVVVAAAVGSSLAQDPFARLLAAAEGGDSGSQLRVGVKYATGDGVRVNGSEAVRWLERAAASNGKTAATAAGWLGVVYERGMGVRKSGETAVRWYTRGAELGSGTSAHNLGELYLAGSLVTKNETLGYEWYARAAKLYEADAAAGDASAAYQAGRIYHRGMGVSPDRAKAIALFEIASAAGNADATKMLNEIRAQPRGGVAAAPAYPAWRPAADPSCDDVTQCVANVLEQRWKTEAVEVIPLGKVAISHGLTTDRNPAQRRFNQADLQSFKAWQRAGIIRIEELKNLTKEFTGWDDWFKLTQGGVGSEISITLTKQGSQLNLSGDTNAIYIPLGSFRVTKIISNEALKKDFDRYHLVLGLHKAEWAPEFEQMLRLKGEAVPASSRKFRALFKFDQFTSQWKLIATDNAGADEEFPLNRVQKALDVHK